MNTTSFDVLAVMVFDVVAAAERESVVVAAADNILLGKDGIRVAGYGPAASFRFAPSAEACFHHSGRTPLSVVVDGAALVDDDSG